MYSSHSIAIYLCTLLLISIFPFKKNKTATFVFRKKKQIVFLPFLFLLLFEVSFRLECGIVILRWGKKQSHVFQT